VRHLFDAVWNEARFDGLDTLWAPEAPFHFRGRAPSVGPGQLRDQVAGWRTAFPDFRFAVEDLVAEGDRVAARLRFTGTHTGDAWFGRAPTGREIDVTAMMFFRLRGGLVVEVWEDYDEHALRRQLGLLP
jgi:predicted ester cyclase